MSTKVERALGITKEPKAVSRMGRKGKALLGAAALGATGFGLGMKLRAKKNKEKRGHVAAMFNELEKILPRVRDSNIYRALDKLANAEGLRCTSCQAKLKTSDLKVGKCPKCGENTAHFDLKAKRGVGAPFGGSEDGEETGGEAAVRESEETRYETEYKKTGAARLGNPIHRIRKGRKGLPSEVLRKLLKKTRHHRVR